MDRKQYHQNLLVCASAITALAFAVVGIIDSSLGSGATAAAIVFSFFLAGYRQVDSTEVAVLFVLGKAVFAAPPGPIFTVLLFTELRKASGQNIEEEVPDDPEQIYWGDADAIPDGMVMPTRITFAPYRPNQQLPGDICAEIEKDGVRTMVCLEPPPNPVGDPLNNRMTAVVQMYFVYRITDPMKFLIRIGDEDEARRQLIDFANGVYNRLLTRISVATAKNNLELLSTILERAMDNYVKDWGIDFTKVEIKSILFSHAQNRAMSSVVEAEYTGQATIINAEADRVKRVKAGEGDGKADEARLKGKTDGLVDMMTRLQVNGDLVLANDTATRVGTTEGRTVLVAEGLGKLAGVAAAVAGAMQEKKP